MFIFGHVGFYYLSGVTAQILGVPMNDISQDISKLKISELDRKILTQRLNNYQSRISGKVFHRGGSLLGVVKAVKRNEAISLFIDALTTENDPVVNFLGRKTRAPQGPIRISMQTGAAIIFAPAIRERDGGMTLTFYEPVSLENTGDRDKDLQNNAQKLMNLLEPVIRQHPDQWHLWRTFHERSTRENDTGKQHSIEGADSGAGRRHDGAHSPLG
ncbi:MAG: lysophospholipid acyltransferase family protein [Candidatus Lindowbacteria bacterium]|nr:lysophospholipid acyltransferase family protein [Candidatus Lindowbacteria bacterium]